MRVDLKLIEQWIPNNSYILDLGCGDGSLLQNLRRNKNIQGIGIEINSGKIQQCLEKNVPVIELDMSEALQEFDDNSFDIVVMTQSLQVVKQPQKILKEALRVGKDVIIAFPNFAHWSNRMYLNFKGKMPVSKNLPYSWYDTPNIHFFTVKDFNEYCTSMNLSISSHAFLDRTMTESFLSKRSPNIFSSIAMYKIRDEQ